MTLTSAGESAASLGLTGRETYTIHGLTEGLVPRKRLTVVARTDASAGGADPTERQFETIARLDGQIDVDYYRHGGILPAVLRRIAAES
jgi:aconitate hydratase